MRIAYLAYRTTPNTGGQAVYTRALTEQLVALGHRVTVFAGSPYPDLHPSVEMETVPSLELYRNNSIWNLPRLSNVRSLFDVHDFLRHCTGEYTEPWSFSVRVERMLSTRRHEFDVIHDNQSLGSGIVTLHARGWPVVANVHHPITVDRETELAAARTRRKRGQIARWYKFVDRQIAVARQLPLLLTLSNATREEIAEAMGVCRSRVAVVPVGVDTERFRPRPETTTVPGRVLAVASQDVPFKGVIHLLHALRSVRSRHDATLVLVARLRRGGATALAIEDLGLANAVEVRTDVSETELSRLYNEAEVAVVPSLYEGFSLPAVQAMASGTPLIATSAGALPEVIEDHALIVPPADSPALAGALLRLLEDEPLRHALARGAREHVLRRYSWRRTAELTLAAYESVIARDGPQTS